MELKELNPDFRPEKQAAENKKVDWPLAATKTTTERFSPVRTTTEDRIREAQAFNLAQATCGLCNCHAKSPYAKEYQENLLSWQLWYKEELLKKK